MAPGECRLTIAMTPVFLHGRKGPGFRVFLCTVRKTSRFETGKTPDPILNDPGFLLDLIL